MAKHLSKPQQSVSHQARVASSIASIQLPEDGGASASTLHSALSSDPVLTGLQDAFSVMPFNTNQTPRNSLSANDPFQDISFENYSFDFPQDDSQYTLASIASSVNPRYLDSSAIDINGVTSHRPGPDPWTHVDATVGPGPGLPSLNSDDSGLPSGHLRTPTHARGPSSSSEQRTFVDSAYATGSRKSHHASEVESLGEQQSDIMEEQNMDSPIHNHDHAVSHMSSGHAISHMSSRHPASRISSDSSTITPTPFSNSRTISSPRQPSTRQPEKRASEFVCRDCGYSAKTRSDLKKHSARHTREYKCTLHDCPQNKKGFATSNDRDRHMKAVHKIQNRLSKSYKCFGEGCTKTDKEWPRLDNFKQHLTKMHGEDNVNRLLGESIKWYERREQPGTMDETVIRTVPQHSFGPQSAMSVEPPFEQYQNQIFTNSTPSYNSGPSGGSDMNHSPSQDNSSYTPNLDPRLKSPYHSQSRSVSGSLQARNFGHSSPRPFVMPKNFTSYQPSVMPKTRSHVDFLDYQDLTQIQNNFSDQAVNYQFAPMGAANPSSNAMRMDYSSGQGIVSDQPRRFKKARTIAGSDPRFMAEFPSPQKPRPVPLDVRVDQGAFLGLGGGSIASGNISLPPSSPHQGFEVNIVQPPDDTSKSGLTKLMVDDITSFLANHKAKAGGQELTAEELYKQFRLTLRTSDTLTSCGVSSVGPVSGRADTKNSAGIHCPATKETYFVCDICHKPKKRQSDLNKHMQRHSKPYGCVFDKCQKIFGSKNDWKRHEQTQHEQQECWRCHLCFEVFFLDQSRYIQHMLEQHMTQNPEESARKFRVARNYQGRFWCGFCCEIFTHSKTDVEAITLRFDHIADHFTKDKKVSKDWVELAGKGKTKQQIQDEQSQTTTESEDNEVQGISQDAAGSAQSPSSQQSDSPMQRTFSHHSSSSEGLQGAVSSMQDMFTNQMPPTQTHAHLTMAQAQPHGQHGGFQQQPYPAHHVRSKVVFCCHCNGYSSNISLSPRCMDCNHVFCADCPREQQYLVDA